MKLYILIIEDRHTDTDVIVFDDADVAINTAKELAKLYCRCPEDLKEEPVEGWLFNIEYSCESDGIRVVEKTLNEGNL